MFNTLSPAPGRIKEGNVAVVVSVAALVRLVVVATKVKNLAVVELFVQVLKAARCHCRSDCPSMVLSSRLAAVTAEIETLRTQPC